MLHELISHQGSHFKKEVATLLETYKIQHNKPSPYCSQANAVIDAANKNVLRIIEKMAKNYKDWPDKLLFSLWGYRTSICTSTEETPCFLVYRIEVVLPIEITIPSIKVISESKISESE